MGFDYSKGIPYNKNTGASPYQKPGGGGGTTTGGYSASPGYGTSMVPQQQQQPAKAAPPSNASPYGYASGPGILENWFNQRATGTDPAFEYAMGRGNTALDNQYSAAGSYNSGAAAQGKSDLYANLIAQREGQLDQLAAGASGEHQNRLNSMFAQGQSLYGGEAGLATAYDLGAAGNTQAANNAQNQMALNKAGVDSQANQALWNNIIKGYAAYQSGGAA